MNEKNKNQRTYLNSNLALVHLQVLLFVLYELFCFGYRNVFKFSIACTWDAT